MGDRSPPSMDAEAETALPQLMSADRSALLDVIDQLRNLGVNQYVELPTILVCGDQSSGKSSVLEAICKLPFPKGDNVCTTFATELAIRRGPQSSVSVWIQPAESRSADEKQKISSFKTSSEDLGKFEMMVKEAKAFLIKQSNASEASYFEDVLHIDVSNPVWPPLTVVDLPGIIQYQNLNQTSEDVRVVHRLVRSHLKNSKSIIMAVISAKTDASNQEILKLAREMDPNGIRTLAVITKPDTLARGSDDETAFLTYAKNKSPNFTFKHGWHVIKNRSYETRNSSLDERDVAEEMFFANSVWENVLGSESLGIDALRARLSTLLEDHTRALLPVVISSIKELTDTCDKELKKLGESRETPDLQRRYLSEIGERFQRIVEQAVEGNYVDDFFSPQVEKHLRHLRATIQNMNENFAHVMATKGHNRHFYRSFYSPPNPEDESSASTNSQSSYDHIEAPLPTKTGESGDEHIAEIKDLMKATKGKELPTLFNPSVVREVFRHQSSKWEDIANIHLEGVWMATQQTLSIIARHVANEDTARRLLRNVIDLDLDNRRAVMMDKLQEVLVPYKRIHPLTLDHTFAHRIKSYAKMDPVPSIKAMDNATQAAWDAWNAANTYYDIALGTFVDNTAVLVVEMCLVDGLEKIFSPRKVALMESEILDQLASENPTTRTKRTRLQTKYKMLKAALNTCLRHSDRSQQATRSFPPSPAHTKFGERIGRNNPPLPAAIPPAAPPAMALKKQNLFATTPPATPPSGTANAAASASGVVPGGLFSTGGLFSSSQNSQGSPFGNSGPAVFSKPTSAPFGSSKFFGSSATGNGSESLDFPTTAAASFTTGN